MSKVARIRTSGMYYNDDEHLNVFLTADKLTVRVLSECSSIMINDKTLHYTDTSTLLTHDELDISVKDNAVDKVWVINSKKYFIRCEQSISLKSIPIWKPFNEIIISGNFNRNFPYIKSNDLVYNDRYSLTYFTKDDEWASNYTANTFLIPFARFVVQHPEDTFDTCNFILKCRKNVITNIDFDAVFEDETVTTNIDPSIEQWMISQRAKYEIIGPDTIAENQMVTLTVNVRVNGELIDFDHEVRLENLDGYLPHRRLVLKNGTGTFNIRALGLNSGETMRVKINDGFFTSRAEKILTVI